MRHERRPGDACRYALIAVTLPSRTGLRLFADLLMASTLPTREAFVSFWSRRRNPLYSPLNLVIYFGGLLSFCTVRQSPLLPSQSIALGIAAIIFTIGAPLLYCVFFWTRNDRFLRCPHCRVWVGSDLIGNPYKNIPNWQRVALTSRCVRCGERMIQDKAELDTAAHKPEAGNVPQ
jgi:hypothetical protein